jgi:hypothetical protein
MVYDTHTHTQIGATNLFFNTTHSEYHGFGMLRQLWRALLDDKNDYAFLFNPSGDVIHLCALCVPRDAEHGSGRCAFCHTSVSSSNDSGDEEDKWMLCFGGWEANVTSLCARCHPTDDGNVHDAFRRLKARMTSRRRTTTHSKKRRNTRECNSAEKKKKKRR